MMKFRTAKQALVDILGAEAAGNFRVIGYQPQAQDESENLENDRSVQVFYTKGKMKKSAGSITGPVDHNAEFGVELQVSAEALGDLSILQNPGSTPAELQAALSSYQDAADRADSVFDEFADLVYQIIMGVDKRDLDQPIGFVSDRWVDEMAKDKPSQIGQLVSITGYLSLSLRVSEEITGAILTKAVTPAIDTTIDLVDDEGVSDNGKAGVVGGS